MNTIEAETLGGFWPRVEEQSDGCWLWRGKLDRAGYGQFLTGNRKEGNRRWTMAHRWAYDQFVGFVPAGLELDHLCRRRHCVNPDHLEAVTHKVNILRGESPTAVNARKTHCPQGHPYSGENLKTLRTRTNRECRTCIKMRRSS